MFKEQGFVNIEENKREPKDPVDNEKGNFSVNNQRTISEALNLVNEDCPGSQEIANLDDNKKLHLFFERYQGDPLKFFEKENFDFLKSLNYSDRNLAKGVMFTNEFPKECLVKYHKEFPEDKVIDDIILRLFIDLERYTDEDDARINNQEYNQAFAKLLEVNLFLDKNLRLIKNDPEVFNYFIDNYKLFISGIKEDAKKLNNVINDSLYQKTLSFSEAFSAIISRLELKLLELEQVLKTKDNPKEVIANFIQELNSDSKNRTQNIQELGKIAIQLNKQYEQLGEDVVRGIASVDSVENQSITEDSLGASLNDFGLDEYNKELFMNDFQEHKKFSAERLKEMIAYYQEAAEAEKYSPEIMQMVYKDFEDEKIKKGEEAVRNFNWSERMEKYSKEFPQPKTEEQLVYEEAIKKLQQILPLQIALEKKMDQLVYGREETKLPKGFSSFENSKVIPENIPEQAPLYFPVGISKDLISWEQTLAGEKKFAKPIDLYGYLFWLNNQGRKVNLVICDEIQVNNYQVRYGKSESEVRQKAREIGNRETEQYEKIINTFGLDNINIQRYQEFINSNKDEYERYSSVVKNLAIQPAFKEAFLAMVQESVSGAEKEEYIGYALEELTWILSTNGTKVGHLNEARYDILGAVIRNFEQIGKEKGQDVLNNPESPEAKVILNTVCKIIRDVINEKKSKLDKNSSSLAYFQRLQDYLGKIKTDSKAGYDKSVKKDSLSLNFVCPDVGSASFGFRGDFEAKESVVKFKEPYSTYFYKNDSDLLINSDQVVATGEGLIGGKILTLDNKEQLKYAESVVRPILKHYFATLEKAPAEYFKQVNKSREELLVEGQEATSLVEVLRFIQKYIVKPSQLA